MTQGKKKSKFIQDTSVPDTHFFDTFGNGVNRKIAKPDLFKQIRDNAQTFIYNDIADLRAANLEADPDDPVYVRVAETGFWLYQITSLAATAADIVMDNGTTATRIYEETAVIPLNDITSLPSLNTAALMDGQQFNRLQFWDGTGVGGAPCYWDANRPVSEHNGGTIVDPARVSELNPATKEFNDYFTPDTVSGDTGCFVVLTDSARPEHFGCLLGSTQNNHTAVQAYADAMAGGTLKFTEGQTYRWDSEVLIATSETKIDATGATIDLSNLAFSLTANQPTPGFRVQGSVLPTLTVTADIAEGDLFIQLSDVSGLERGDGLYLLSSGELWYTEFATTVEREFVAEVAHLDAGTNRAYLTCAVPIPFDATISHTVSAEAFRPVRNVVAYGGSWLGGGLRNSNTINGTGTSAILFQYAADCYVLRGFEISGFQGIAVRGDYGIRVGVKNGVFYGRPKSLAYDEVVEGQNSGFYGAFFNKALIPIWDNVGGIRTRHLQDASHSWYGMVTNCNAYDNHRGGFGSHAGCGNFSYVGGSVTSSANGIQWRGWSFSVSGVDIKCLGRNAAGIYDADGGQNDIPKKITITGGSIITDRNGIEINGNIGQLAIGGGISVKSGFNSTDYHPIVINSLDLDRVSISSAALDANGGSYCLIANFNAGIRSRGFIKMIDCSTIGYTNSAGRVFGNPNIVETVFVAKENDLDTSLGATVHFNSQDTALTVKTPNYLENGTVYS